MKTYRHKWYTYKEKEEVKKVIEARKGKTARGCHFSNHFCDVDSHGPFLLSENGLLKVDDNSNYHPFIDFSGRAWQFVFMGGPNDDASENPGESTNPSNP